MFDRRRTALIDAVSHLKIIICGFFFLSYNKNNQDGEQQQKKLKLQIKTTTGIYTKQNEQKKTIDNLYEWKQILYLVVVVIMIGVFFFHFAHHDFFSLHHHHRRS